MFLTEYKQFDLIVRNLNVELLLCLTNIYNDVH